MQRVSAGPEEQSHKENRFAAVLGYLDENLWLTNVFAQALHKVGLEFLEGHPGRVDVAYQRQIDVSVAIDPKRPVIDFLRLWGSNQNLVVRSQYIVRTNCIGRKLLERLGGVLRRGILGARLRLRKVSLNRLGLLSQNRNPTPGQTKQVKPSTAICFRVSRILSLLYQDLRQPMLLAAKVAAAKIDG